MHSLPPLQSFNPRRCRSRCSPAVYTSWSLSRNDRVFSGARSPAGAPSQLTMGICGKRLPVEVEAVKHRLASSRIQAWRYSRSYGERTPKDPDVRRSIIASRLGLRMRPNSKEPSTEVASRWQSEPPEGRQRGVGGAPASADKRPS